MLTNALLSLGVLASPETPIDSILENMIHHPSPGVRSACAFALKRITAAGVRHEKLLTTLHTALQDSDPGVRLQTAAALGSLQETQSVSFLIPMLDDPMPLIATAAAYSLGRIGDRQAIDSLIRALESPSPRIREASQKALTKITGKNHGPNAWDWKALDKP